MVLPEIKIPIFVKHIYLLTLKDYKNKKGLSERYIKRYLEKKRFAVWRTSLINIFNEQDEIYPNVRRKYALLHRLLKNREPKLLELLKYMHYVNHGLPDFIIYRNKRFSFVECKLEYEQLSFLQKKTISYLIMYGYNVEVIKLVRNTKMRESIIDIMTGNKYVLKKQERIYKKKYAKVTI